MSERAGASNVPTASMPDELGKAIKKEAVGYVAKAVIATAAGVVGLAALGLWLYVKTILPDVVGGVPRGAVMAFDRDDLSENACPPGWSPFLEARARTIIGAGDPANAPGKMKHDDKEMPLRGFVHRQHGGMQITRLTIAEMPPHSHKLRRAVRSGQNNNFPVYEGQQSADPELGEPETLPQGGGNGFTNMPPFVALYFCKKS